MSALTNAAFGRLKGPSSLAKSRGKVLAMSRSRTGLRRARKSQRAGKLFAVLKTSTMREEEEIRPVDSVEDASQVLVKAAFQ